MPRKYEAAEPGAYTNAEIAAMTDKERWAFPRRGVRCAKCNTVVPEFADLSAEEAQRARALNRAGDFTAANEAIRRATGCGERWAKIWLMHPNGALATWSRDEGGPCPTCGKRLRTEQARQCFHCGADWH